MSSKQKVNEHQKEAFKKWLAYWKTTCDWSASPQPSDAWNAAIDLVSNYLSNGFCENELYNSIPKMDKVVEKLERFKVK